MGKSVKVSEATWKKLKQLSLDTGKTIAVLIEELL
jgi:hypothetical protein